MRNTPRRRICLRLAPLTTKDFSRHRYNTASCAPARRDVDRVFCPLVRSFLRVASPGQYALMLWLFSCRCDSSFQDGRRPGRFVLRSPGSAFPIRNRGFLRVRGVTHWQFDLRGMRSGLCANPFPIRIVQINYGVLSSAAGSCRSACRAARLASFSAACSCRNLLSWRLPFRPSKYRRENGGLRPETAFCLCLLTSVTSPFVRNSLKGELRIHFLSAPWQHF